MYFETEVSLGFWDYPLKPVHKSRCNCAKSLRDLPPGPKGLTSPSAPDKSTPSWHICLPDVPSILTLVNYPNSFWKIHLPIVSLVILLCGRKHHNMEFEFCYLLSKLCWFNQVEEGNDVSRSLSHIYLPLGTRSRSVDISHCGPKFMLKCYDLNLIS